jgi:hypothetical protein
LIDFCRGNRGDPLTAFAVLCGEFRLLASLRGAHPQQVAARHEKLGERTSYKQPMRVLVRPAVADRGEAKDPLDDKERVFDLGLRADN